MPSFLRQSILPYLAVVLNFTMTTAVNGQVIPEPRAHHQLVYHAGEKNVYLIGGSTKRGDGYHYYDEMWSLDGSNWDRVTSLPFPRSSHRLVYHETRNSLVLFGGSFGKAVRAEGVLWEWKDNEWKAAGGNFRAGRNEPGMCYDRKRKRVVVFGGWDSTSTYRGDTWEWDGEDFIRVDSTGPGPRAGHAFLYDSVRQRCLLFGGRNEEKFLSDTWTWDGAEWVQLEASGPSARWFFGAAADPENGTVVIFGGRGPDGDLGDTWIWDGSGWEQVEIKGPPARSMAKMAFTGWSIVLFGGREDTQEGFRDYNDTWELYLGSWVQRR